ncbi:MSMEG_0570 family nitrogen starvation response protein [Saccharopolyspora dendranthemae]|uniref:Putative repeat protein (TIGR04042 family) n=1 Tax=Saccharopolyspora dendranthemae TaxID=1181886 RepID=A0A561V7N2_9PSEU|nr:MSMEG_0570 family nitrogen starvation response protein [Saccharopolyspora dendranthemae]TWG07629.1 putative repeat protein (TIGR04042 family) [Saccharopolyspora dendranthemae]
MPEMHFQVRWPDGAVQQCYSPSTIIEDYLEAGGVYTVADFVERSRQALEIASDRVRAKFGMGCTAAAGQLAEITATSDGHRADDRVTVEALIHPPGRTS